MGSNDSERPFPGRPFTEFVRLYTNDFEVGRHNRLPQTSSSPLTLSTPAYSRVQAFFKPAWAIPRPRRRYKGRWSTCPLLKVGPFSSAHAPENCSGRLLKIRLQQKRFSIKKNTT